VGYSDDIPVVYENGVFRPEGPVNIPEHSRLRITIQEITAGSNGAPNGQSLADILHGLRARGLVRSAGWRPTRDQLHERR
jgi:predicted DNA-binding antitoxin AbrB/MazE fold protein